MRITLKCLLEKGRKKQNLNTINKSQNITTFVQDISITIPSAGYKLYCIHVKIL